jgi:hypothetical protein
MQRVFVCLLVLATPSVAEEPPSSWSTLTFTTPVEEPSENQGSKPIIGGGVPIGNGETTALYFPTVSPFNTSSEFGLSPGVHLYLGMTTAMASDTTLMPLAIVSIETEPPLGIEGFAHSLHLENASATVSTSVGTVAAWVEENNRVVARVVGAAGRALRVNVSVHSLRPSARFTYYSRCSSPTSAPDTWSHPAGGDSIGLFHRNEDSDVALLNVPAAFNATLEQQGLGHLAAQLQPSDHWRHRTFGLVLSADGLVRTHRARLATTAPQSEVELTITTLAQQTVTADEWERRAAALHRTHTRADSTRARAAHNARWQRFWERSHVWVSAAADQRVGGSSQQATALQDLTARYAQTRYLQAIQAGTWVPIKFNGMLFTGQLPPETTSSGPSYRGWGSSNWWQNTRLAYWNMAASGDVDSLETIFTYYEQMAPFLRERTRAAFGHDGIYATETKTLFGAYDPCDYGTPAANRTDATHPPFGYQESRWLRYDFGGDAGLPEVSMMVLDHFLYAQNTSTLMRYLPLLDQTLTFFAQHYNDLSPTGATLRVSPSQGLETYQCKAMRWPQQEGDCPTNDHPTIAALYVLTERALELPPALTTAAQRARWAALRDALPPLPMTTDESEPRVPKGALLVSPYEGWERSAPISNCETPELYSTHPFRLLTLGRSLLGERREIAPSIYCLENSTRKTCRNADLNTGWTQGLLNAALLGRAALASARVLERAQTHPAAGYRFPAFAPHMQDYEPSEDHFANMATALQLMLLAPADDGANASALLFPAWPCAWDVDFKLWAPRRTAVSGKLQDGKLLNFDVQPPERRAAIVVRACQK